MAKEKNLSELARKQLLDRIEQLIEQKDLEELRQLLSDSRSSDVAEVVEVLDEIARQILFDLLAPEDAGEVLEKIDEATRTEIVEDLTNDELTNIVATLPPDEAADVVADLSDAQTEKILDQIPKAESAQIEKLLSYDEESAGGIMTPEVVAVNVSGTIGDAIEQIRKADPEEDFYHVFVVDENRKFKGTVNIQTLLRRRPDTAIADVLEEELPTVGLHTDQEEIANIFRKNDLIVMPVVNKNGILMGRITVDDIVDVMEEEAEEDVLVMAGTHPDELDTPKIFKAASVRLPWLLTCMIGAMISGIFLISIFVPHFKKPEWMSIFMFFPAIIALGGNSGLQTSTIVVRGLSTGDLAALNIQQVFLREGRVAVIVAIFCGFIAGVISATWLSVNPGELNPGNGAILGLSIGLSMFCGIILSTSLGIFLPFFFRKIGVDPAISSGPLVTTANDALGGLTYLSLALLLLKCFGG
ncbi:MAG: magnesium transporter [Sedimentisphaerales bacterium]|nr:magnesium transporter [Sedimentisphaerales bacterium]